MTVREYLECKSSRTNAALEAYFRAWNGAPDMLLDAMRYSLFAGGKRLRPALALGAAEIVCGTDDTALPAACAVEMIHTYSLIHDDLPAMDNDDMRRGQPTAHRKFGEAVAILAGDTMLTMAFEVLAQAGNVQVIQEVAQAAGVRGMAAGQLADLASENQQLSLEALQQIHSRKTGALIRVSVRSGAILAGASPEQLSALTRYGEQLGLAFQITDDILDVIGSPEALGKPVGGDAAKKKSTYPAIVGLDQARACAKEATNGAITALEPFGEAAQPFRNLATYLIERQN